MKKKVIVVCLVFLCLFCLAACGKTEQLTEEVPENTEVSLEERKGDQIYSYINENYGFCDDDIHGIYTSTVIHQMNSATLESQIIEFDNQSKSGAVFYKVISEDTDKSNVVCVYLENEDGRVSLNLDYFELNEQGFPSKSSTRTIADPHMKSRCYCYVGLDYVTVIELFEKCEGFYDGNYYLARSIDEHDMSLSSDEYYYEENVAVYDLNNNFDEVLKIKRKISPPNPNETKICTLLSNDDIYAYASGVIYSHDAATLLATEQEFCDKANELLRSLKVDEITLTRTSWQNRWYRLEIREDEIPENMVKVDCLCSDGISEEKGIVNSDVRIVKNAEKEEHGELPAEAPDTPISYGTTENNIENEPVLPDNIPSSVEASQLQELDYFNLDGFWYSSDMHYVMSINVGSQFWNTFHYVNLYSSDGIKRGSVQQTSSYSINLNANEDAEKDFEVFASNGKLVSDEITFIRASGSVSNNILGNWHSGDKTYRFDNDGTYTVLMKNDSYWGYYFPVDESRIVLGVYSENLKDINHSFECFDYTLDAESFVIKGFASLSR